MIQSTDVKLIRRLFALITSTTKLKKIAYSTNPEKTTVDNYEWHSPKSLIDFSWALSRYKFNMF